MAAELPVEALRGLRLDAQLLRSAPAGDPLERVVAAVDRLFALQGQDFPAVQRAIALRAGVRVEDVREAFDRGLVVRGWPMRGTLFATTPRNLAALGGLTRTRGMASVPRRREQLGIDAALVERAAAAGLARLSDGPATRAEMLAAWEADGIDTSGQRGYHLIATLSQEGLWHWGALRGAEQLLEASAGRLAAHADDADRAALLVRVLLGYLAGHGPAALDDLSWWLKHPKTELRAAARDAGDSVAAVRVGGVEHLVLAGALARGAAEPAEDEVRLLPAFDEYYLGYADRSPIASPAVQEAVVPGGNGMFRPTVVAAGRVVGTWARGTRKSDPPVIVELLEPVSPAARAAIDGVLR